MKAQTEVCPHPCDELGPGPRRRHGGKCALRKHSHAGIRSEEEQGTEEEMAWFRMSSLLFSPKSTFSARNGY